MVVKPQERPRLRTPLGSTIVVGVLLVLSVAGTFAVSRLTADLRTLEAAGRAEIALTDLRQSTTREMAVRYRTLDDNAATPAEVWRQVFWSAHDIGVLRGLQADGYGDYAHTIRAYESFRDHQDTAADAPPGGNRVHLQGLAADRESTLREAADRDLVQTRRLQAETEASVMTVVTLAGIGLGGGLIAVIVQWTRVIRSLRRVGYEDRVTGLANRRALRASLEGGPTWRAGRRRGPRAMRSWAPGVVVVDLDDFKDINDTHGHTAGDALLRDVAARLTGAVGSDGFTGRLGSDEFGVIVSPGVDPVALAERVAAALDHPFTVAGAPLQISSSIGVALPGGTDDPFASADLAMYEAKRSGKGAVRLFTPDLADAAERRTRLRTDLRQAIDRGEIWVAYQPIVDLSTGTPTWLEALVRWEHPTGGPISPNSFVPLAEGIGVIARIDRHVLRRATQDAAVLGVGVSVNVSPRHMAAGGLAEVVSQALDASGLPPHMLVVEVTESALSRADSTAIIEQLRDLRRLGVLVAIDDFGTGQSSLARLAELPVDVLKVDRSFIADHAGATTRELLPVVAELGRRLRLRTVVEGIETPEQLAVVTGLGFDMGQGFLLGRPQATAHAARDGAADTARDLLLTRRSLPAGAVIPHPANTFDDLPEGGRARRR